MVMPWPAGRAPHLSTGSSSILAHRMRSPHAVWLLVAGMVVHQCVHVQQPHWQQCGKPGAAAHRVVVVVVQQQQQNCRRDCVGSRQRYKQYNDPMYSAPPHSAAL